MNDLCPGGDGEPLPPDELVFKLVLPTSEDEGTMQATPEMFALTSREKSGSGRLSVYASRLTSPTEAWGFLNESQKYKHYITLNVTMIRAIRIPGSGSDAPPLDIVWHPMSELAGRPGSAGHAGSVGLHENTTPSNEHRKYLRKELSKIANKLNPFR
jgi:hypothetical protein